MQHCNEEHGWRLDRRVNISTVVSALTSLAIAVGMIVSLETRLDALESGTAQMREEVREARKTVLQVERIDERIIAMHRMLEEIKVELRQRREVRP
jgi:DNA/RNA endonuclease YhcR with UshA esterase domain